MRKKEKRIKWRSIPIPEKLLNDINEIVEKSQVYTSAAEFIRNELPPIIKEARAKYGKEEKK